MATFTFFDEYANNQGLANINLSTDTFQAALSNTAIDDAADDELVDITQIAGTNGYTTDGVVLTTVDWSETGGGTGIWQFTVDDFSWTASGGTLTFRWIIIFSQTSTNDKLVGYWDAGSALVLPDGFVFTMDIGANGVFRVGPGTIS